MKDSSLNKKNRVRINVILVNPLDDANIGSVCRAMKSMGIHYLSLVTQRKIDHNKAGILAVHAADLLKKVKIFKSLARATAKAVLIAGITRRKGKNRKSFSYTPEQLAQRIRTIKEGNVCLVFGNERTGLTGEELACCHLAVTIPSAPAFPSLNLSHAVQIICYTIFCKLNNQAKHSIKPIKSGDINTLVHTVLKILKTLGFFKITDSREMGIFLKDIFARAELCTEEARHLEHIFKKIGGLFSAKIKKDIDPKAN